jgi:hypothetical protein
MTNDWGEAPQDVAALDRRLRQLDFEPRTSLAPELEGRARRGEEGQRPHRRPRRWLRVAAAAGVALALAVGSTWHGDTTVDRCCSDLDGGGLPDDGISVIVGRDRRVRRVSVYEDRDHSGGLSGTDTIRYSGSGDPAKPVRLPPGFQAARHCCEDYDGGGVADDGVLVLGLPPDRVAMAVLYEEARSPASPAAH